MKDIRVWQCILTNRAVHLIIRYQLGLDGKLIAKRTIPDEEKIFSIMHGDSRKMFMFSSVNNRIVYIDKSNIEKGDIKELR